MGLAAKNSRRRLAVLSTLKRSRKGWIVLINSSTACFGIYKFVHCIKLTDETDTCKTAFDFILRYTERN